MIFSQISQLEAFSCMVLNFTKNVTMWFSFSQLLQNDLDFVEFTGIHITH